MGSIFTGTLGVILFFFLLATAVLWFILPFAVFGIKSKLDTALQQSAATIVQLQRIEAAIRNPNTPLPAEPPKKEIVYDC